MNKAFIEFLIKAKKNSYAAGVEIKEKDNSYSARFEENFFKYHDNWFGGKTFGGREIVFYKARPFWIMVFFGSGSEAVIPTLKKALLRSSKNFPARGPKNFRNGKFEYKNKWQGNIEKFSGEEIIIQNKKIIYSAKYIGGLISN